MKKQRHLPIAAAIFNDEGKVLLTKRHNPKNSIVHGKWQIPGGSIIFGEQPIETVLREIKEETSLSIKLLTKHPLVYSHVFDTNTHRIIMVYPAKYISGDIDISHDRETSDAKWFIVNEINETECLPQTKEAVTEAKEIVENF